MTTNSDSFIPQQERVRNYFHRHDVPLLLEQLLAELGDKMPREPIQGIAEWAATKLRLQASTTSSSMNPAPPRTPHAPLSTQSATSRPPSAPSSRPQSANIHKQQSLSMRARQKRWTVLLIGSDAARDYYFDVLVQGLGASEGEGGAEEHSRIVRETIRPFFPGKKSIRMIAHTLDTHDAEASETNSVVVLDPAMVSWSSEKNLFAMSIADVVVVCCEPQSGQLPAIVGAHPVRDYVKMATRTGTRGILVWSNALSSSAGAADATNDVLAPLKLESNTAADARLFVSRFKSSPPLLSDLLSSISLLPIETIRPERPELQSGIFSSSLASLGSSIEYELECRIDSLEDAEIRVGDALRCFVSGQRIEVSIVTIDLVFTGRQPTQVIRRGVDKAGGVAEGAMVTCIAKGMQNSITAKGAPSMTLVRVEPISEAVTCVITAQLLNVSVVAPSSDDDDDELDF